MHATCQRCGVEFETARPHTKFCSATCRSAASKARKRDAVAGEVAQAANVVALSKRRALAASRPRRSFAGGPLERTFRAELGPDLIETSAAQQAIILCRAMDDPTTSPSALAALSKQMLLLAGSILGGKALAVDEDLVSKVQAQVIAMRASHAAKESS